MLRPTRPRRKAVVTFRQIGAGDFRQPVKVV
jgi:hypothetical protein